MANQLLSRLQADGRFSARNRMYIGQRGWDAGLFAAAFVVGRENAYRIDAVVRFMLATARDQAKEERCTSLHLYGDLCRYLAHREALLAGGGGDA